ncbi:MAG: DUF615 domain-containing protein [Marinobacterium sp.]|nr:DUF615 domain-containing protein [Marinobacterium sp.]
MTQEPDFKDGQGPESEEDWVSKTQVKKEVNELKALGERLTTLTSEQLGKIEMGDRLRAAVEESRRIKPRTNAMKRHLGFIGKLMLLEDAEQIQYSIEQFSAGTTAHTAAFAKLERWRDRLINGGNNELQAYLEAYPAADIQHLRQLIRNASKAASKETPDPAPARKLFKYLREVADI